MPHEKASKRALELHREMFKRRSSEIAWRRGQTQREIMERINAPTAKPNQQVRVTDDKKDEQ